MVYRKETGNYFQKVHFEIIVRKTRYDLIPLISNNILQLVLHS